MRIIRAFCTAAVLAAATAMLPDAAHAQRTINITVSASHPPAVAWVGQITKTFIPEINRILAEDNKYRVRFTEAYSGQLYKVNETLTAVSEGLTNIGWVFSLVEASRLPLTQVTGYVPGVTNDPVMLMEIFNELNDKIPALQQEWDRQNTVFLAATAGDSHQLFTRSPVSSLRDLQGKKLSAPGSVGTWLTNTGAIAVDGTATSFYTDTATGLTDGVSTSLTVAQSIKLPEAAPHVTITNLGSTYFGGLVANKDFWRTLPPEVQAAIRTASRKYSIAVGQEVIGRYDAYLAQLRTNGATLNPPVTVSVFPEAERQRWFAALPNLAKIWVDANQARGLPAREVLSAYMAAARARGVTPIREWDKEALN